MIGVFDSGLGGLTVFNAIRTYAPKADLVYFGDTKNAPYGNKTKEEVKKLAAESIQKLMDEGAVEIVSACNSISISLDAPLLTSLSLSKENIIEMVGPTIQDLKNREEKNILLCATQITIDSGVYQDRLKGIGKKVEELPLPELVSYIESGKNREEVQKLLEKYKQAQGQVSADLILLGCTHYPLVADVFEEVFSIPTYNPANAVAREVLSRFNCDGEGKEKISFSKETKQTQRYTKRTP
tara:strand:- start:4549 stop:5268 length:720 start_codon:yes stop_codon:yes gene_type:complete